MTNICAAIGLAQLKKATKILDMKRRIFNWYLNNLSEDYIFQKTTPGSKNSYWMVTILLDACQNDRDNLRNRLKKNGIETRPIFSPLHTMGHHKKNISLPVAESISDRGLSLPSYPELTEADVNKICSFL